MKHESFIEFLASYLKPDVYVELGVYDGSTFNKVYPHVRGWAYGVDIKPLMDDSDKPNCSITTNTTKEFAVLWSEDIHEDIDLIFIDADHSKEAVLKDAQAFLHWLKLDTGIMVLHDTWPLNKQQTAPGYSGDCYKVTAELKNHYGDGIEVLTIPVSYGLTLIRRVGQDWRNG